MMKLQNANKLCIIAMLSAPVLTACSDDNDSTTDLGQLTPSEEVFGKAVGNFSADEWYPGGLLGTTEAASYSDPAPAVENIAGMEEDFNTGEDFFEHLYTLEQNPRKGLGPAWVRNSCIACHPSYGHGKRQTEYRANQIGNGYLLVIYHPDTNGYITEVTGMPQTQAMTPFKAPIDETQISIEWKNVSEMESGLPMAFADGEQYSLIYPEVRIPQSAFNTNPKPENYDVRLESTIGVYGTGLLDALTDEDIEAQWKAESPYVELNPAMWDKAAERFKASAYYSAPYNDTGTFHGDHGPLKRFTYAMTRGSLQDGAGANAIWNITNVSRGDRPYLYTTAAWAQAMSQNEGVIAAIQADPSSPYYADGTKEGIAAAVRGLLDPSTNQFDNAWHNFTPEMGDDQYYNFLVWHRGLSIPRARDLNREEVQRGKRLFTEIGCASCHRPEWNTKTDNYWAPAIVDGKPLPRYENQKIYPYTDMIQHRLYMKNGIHGSWCRTTPLWGRGLSKANTGAEDRLHDDRARNVVEAIMWHGYSKKSDAYDSTEKFYKLSKSDRDAVVEFINAI